MLEKLLNSTAKIKSLRGGSRSSKTWSILQHIILLCQEGKGHTFTITRSTLTWIKATVLKDFEELIKLYSLPVVPKINPNRPDQTYYLMGNEIAFIGGEEEQKLYGRKQDYFWFNEVMESSRESFDQVEMRTTIGGWLDYNPRSTNHWIYDVEKRKDVELIHSTVLDNPYVPQIIIDKILSYEPTENNIREGTANEYFWNVYGLGKRADLEGLIFQKWDLYEKLPEKIEWEIYGLDFGFTNDPNALIKICKADNLIYWQELIYVNNMTNQDIGNRFESLGLKKYYDVIIADSAEPKSIEELHRMGWVVKPSFKGKDSLMHGIQLLQGHKHFIHKNSLNLQNEFKNYIFETDKEGKPTNKPAKSQDHAIDAGRYAITNRMRNQDKVLSIEIL